MVTTIQGFSTQQQLMDDWCWAAATSSISYFHTPDAYWTQSMLAATFINPVCANVNQQNASGYENTCDQAYDVCLALTRIGNSDETLHLMGQLSFNEIVEQINANLPICCKITFDDSVVGHCVIIYGYDDSYNLIIGDPEDGTHNPSYNDFIAEYRKGTWTETILTKNNSL